MPNRENENDVLGRQPTVLRDVSVTATRKNEFPPSVFRRPSEERMVGKQLKRFSHAKNLLARLFGVLCCNEIKQPFEISERSLSYFDRRHARALGRRALTPVARAAR